MQEDDDVGRIAPSVLPLVSKALELFTAELVGKATERARSSGEGPLKSLEAAHMCARLSTRRSRPPAAGRLTSALARASVECVEAEQLFDFLRATVAKVPAPAPKRARAPAGAGAKKAKAASAEAGAGPSSAPLAESEHRPLAGADDDYDAE